MDQENLINAIQSELGTLNSSVENSMLRELSTNFDLGHSGKLQFEIDPIDFRIHLTQTEEDVLGNYALEVEVEDAAENNDLDTHEAISKEIVKWFSDRWLAINGPQYYSPAFIFFHGGPESPRYDLEHRCWRTVQDVWPELIKKPGTS